MRKTLVMVLAALLLAGCGGGFVGQGSSEEPGQVSTPKPEAGPATKPEPREMPKVDVGQVFEERDGSVPGGVAATWEVVSSEVQASRPMVVEPGDGVAEGPLLVLDVRYVNKGDEYVHVSDSNLEIFTSVKSIDPSHEIGEWTDTYGWDENGEWQAFGEEVAPGAEHRGLVITKLVEDEKPRFLEIKPSYVSSLASASAMGLDAPIVKVDLS